MIYKGLKIDNTFAEAFNMKASRIIVTADNNKWAKHACDSFTGFAQRNIDLSDSTIKQSRYGSKTAKANPLTEVARQQREILENEGFFDLCDVLDDAQKALYPRKSA